MDHNPQDSLLLFDAGSFTKPVVHSFNSLYFLDFYFTFRQKYKTSSSNVISRIMLGNNIDWKRITGSNYPVIQGASITLTTAFWTQLQFPGGNSMWKPLQQSTQKDPPVRKGHKGRETEPVQNLCCHLIPEWAPGRPPHYTPVLSRAVQPHFGAEVEIPLNQVA